MSAALLESHEKVLPFKLTLVTKEHDAVYNTKIVNIYPDKNKGGAPIGNKNGTKIKSQQLRQKAYLSYCDHIATGQPKNLWKFNYKGSTCTNKAMEKYIASCPDEFDPIHKNIAEAKSCSYWFQIVEDSALGLDGGKYKVSYLRAVMRNKFGWV